MNIEDEFRLFQAEMEAQRRHTTTIQESLDTLLACLGVIDNERQQGTPPPFVQPPPRQMPGVSLRLMERRMPPCPSHVTV
jgi:hypothetical protein